eukprot:gene6897-biopygen13495
MNRYRQSSISPTTAGARVAERCETEGSYGRNAASVSLMPPLRRGVSSTAAAAAAAGEARSCSAIPFFLRWA